MKVQGKRVSSLSRRIGGIHSASPLSGIATREQAALGGLQLPHTSTNQEAYPRNVQYQKCFVWGLSDDDNYQISCQIFDFSFADPQRLRLLTNDGIQVRHQPTARHFISALNALHCACRLHDDGFRVVLPDLEPTK